MLYLTLLTPVLALPGLLLMDRVERWAAGAAHSQAFRAARTVPTAETARWPHGSTSGTRTSSAGTTQATPCGPRTGPAPTESGVAMTCRQRILHHPEITRARPGVVTPLRRADDEGRR